MSKNKILILLIVSFLIIFSLLYLLIIKGQKPNFAKLKGKKTFNYILITVDTLRADRIHCYGFNQIETPYMDLFAEKGVKFEKCIAQTPLTLPSHTTILTGTQPIFHGVRDNGGFLVPQELITLAELFKEKGYNTSAFVSAYVLDSKWGLNQGFDYYFDRFDLSKFKTISLGRVQRRGEETINEVLKWLDKYKKKKFFTWIHLYDPHTPYDPPSPFKEKYPGRPYLGEIAYSDYQLGRLWNYLKENNLLDRTILIFASDHGESLGEHRESTHGFFIYQEAVHVPLIFVFPFKKLQGLIRSQVVSLVDIMPTILDMAGIPIPPQVQGKSLVPLFFKDIKLKDNIAYSETYYPRFHFGWSELKGIQNERYKLIIAPKMELYDLINDPDEKINLASKHKGILNKLKTIADNFIREASQNALQVDYRHMDEETRQKLTALGYIGSFTDQSQLEGKELADPKDKITIFNRLSRARELGLQGKFEKAVSIIKKIIKEDPDVIDAYFTLGNLYFKENKFEQAIEYFFKVLEKKPNDTFTIINIANSYIRMGDLKNAEKIILDSIDKVTPDSQLYLILGNIKNFQKKYDEAIRYYKNCLDLNPYSASAYTALGGIYIIQDKLQEAEEYLKRALELNPKLINLHYNYAQLLEKKGDLLGAAEEYKKELENMPHNFRASFNLSRIYRILGDEMNEEKYLNKTVESNPNFPLSYFYLARIYLNRGKDYKKAIELVKKGISLKPTKEFLPFGYFLLADLYNRIGNNTLSRKYAEKGKEIQSSTNH